VPSAWVIAIPARPRRTYARSVGPWTGFRANVVCNRPPPRAVQPAGITAAPSLGNVAVGCLTAPGSPTKNGGYRRLLTPLPAAVDAVQRRSAPDLIGRLRARLAPVSGRQEPAAVDEEPLARFDRRAVAVPGGRRPLDAIHRCIAERGIWPDTRRTPAGQPWTGS
jgi:hypothetical protein